MRIFCDIDIGNIDLINIIDHSLDLCLYLVSIYQNDSNFVWSGFLFNFNSVLLVLHTKSLSAVYMNRL